MVDVFQSTHPARGATGAHLGRTLRRMISIHAPREGCDPAACPRSHSSSISIHAPREGCDYAGDQERKAHVRFQSTHPARGATRDRFDHGSTPLVISIHAPREGCDYNIGHGLKLDKISIHAPREGCDIEGGLSLALEFNFNPRTPRGVRREDALSELVGKRFQSTHPARGATREGALCRWRWGFQSTHPARGATRLASLSRSMQNHFNPRTPRGVRRASPTPITCGVIDFNPRTPRGVRLFCK